MDKIKKRYKYVEWISPEEMHQASLLWMSQLKFARDEQRFLNDLVKSYTLQLTDSAFFEESKTVVDTLLQMEKRIVPLMKQVQKHENQLEIMVDEVDQLQMEQAYAATHRELIANMEQYMTSYREVKTNLFSLVSKVMRKEKQKRLLR